MSEVVTFRLDTNSLAGQLEAACLLEAAARKPGNVHPGASFCDLCFDDFVQSARVSAPIVAQASANGVGQTVLQCVQATQAAVGKNTNLGIILLLTPLAAVSEDVPLAAGIQDVLDRLTVEDSRLTYAAIRAAHPGGMAEVAEQDLADSPTLPLPEIMQLAADRDSIARQYANGFADVLHLGLELVGFWCEVTDDWEAMIQGLFIDLLSQLPDTLIERKLGSEMAREVSRLATGLYSLGWPLDERGLRALAEFDRWLRADGHRRNPGTTADFIAATLFAAMREGIWQPPEEIEVHVG